MEPLLWDIFRPLVNRDDTPRLCRKTDPSTSRMAAEEMVGSGKIGKQEQIILDGIIHHPGLTAAELADYIPLRHDQTHKRLRGMVRKGLLVEGPIRLCRKHWTMMTTWTAIAPRTGQEF
jgi:hypothetical protein